MMCTYSTFAEIVGVTPAQEPAMARILAELDGKLKNWDAANRPKIAALDAQLAEARKGSNIQAQCAIFNTKHALKAERAKLAGPYMAKLVALLTPAQRALWEGDVLFRQMIKAFAPFRLDPAQVDKIRTRCGVAGKAIAALPAAGRTAKAAKVRADLRHDIVHEVFTDQQHARACGLERASTSRARETAAQRAERIRLAAMGFAGKRMAERLRRSSRAINVAVNDADVAARNTRTGAVTGRTSSDRTRNSSRSGSTGRASTGSGGCPPTART